MIRATKQSWIAGIKNGGKGTNYLITCIAAKSSDEIKVKHLWVDEEYLEASAVASLQNPLDKFAAGDTIYIQASRFVSGMPSENTNSDVKKLPVPYKYKGAGLIGYECGNKMKYRSVQKFVELERMNMP